MPRAAPSEAPSSTPVAGASGLAPGDRRERALAELERLRALAREGPAAPATLDLRGLNLVDADLSGLDLSGSDLSSADLSRADLSGTTLMRANLQGASLFQANLAEAELSGADLGGANLTEADLSRAGLGLSRCAGATFVHANLADASLVEADLTGADFRMAGARGARFTDADLRGASFDLSDLRGADLSETRVAGAHLDGAVLSGSTLRAVQGFERASWIGVDLRDIDFTGAHLLRRFVMDQNFIQEFRGRGTWSELAYRLWWVTSDCGRSLARWSLCTAAIAFVFAGIYPFVGLDYGAHRTPLSALYFSVVTLTTLGFGDVVPSTVGGQLVAMVEVVVGYFMLGGLLSILSNKLARRAS